ncbi:hypothetical protein [Streptomyces sp. NBC_00696]|uniref:hypothetical protein n=1 Tax=Streptomyces sp. NBC_00696 TaxID=2903672 RepID=UPI002E315E0A|nr:hypothetical protein [Streptomyces sp. NBC_00696]
MAAGGHDAPATIQQMLGGTVGCMVDAGLVVEQLSLDAGRQARLVAESAADRIRERFGPGVIGPAATYAIGPAATYRPAS